MTIQCRRDNRLEVAGGRNRPLKAICCDCVDVGGPLSIRGARIVEEGLVGFAVRICPRSLRLRKGVVDPSACLH